MSVYTTGGPGPAHDARRIVAKIGEALQQTAPNAPNITCLSYFGFFPSPPAREWAMEDLWTGGKAYGTWNAGAQDGKGQTASGDLGFWNRRLRMFIESTSIGSRPTRQTLPR